MVRICVENFELKILSEFKLKTKKIDDQEILIKTYFKINSIFLIKRLMQ